MLNAAVDLVRPMLLALPPEQAHETTLCALERGLYPRQSGPDDPRLAVSLWGLEFKNPIGVAAGFDKDARVPGAIIGMGCGFAEVGTVTPRPQEGNARPRVFRLIRDRAIINRLGFNSAGHAAVLERLQRRPVRGIVAINVGANKDSADRAGDYVLGIEAFASLASFFTINISSPNTPGLRDLQAPAQLDALLERITAARQRLAEPHRRPIVVKLSPDIAEADLEAVVACLLAHRIDGIAVSNTTLARPGLIDAVAARETGGLSGRPLFHRATVMLARVHRLTGGRVPLIGIGGIDSGQAALAKIEAGASLLQLYTGLVYEGPGLISRIKRHLANAAREAGAASINALAGSKAAEWAAKPLDG
ncbi:MAG TPA: quinone-dependent dihydroorotate dehydrogenase [Hyphomicrobiaceae bacterium]|nr:quinone-dependent dihydroorotate dehydrogenase [Hyphomicrobiaceae bacterium]